MNDKVFTKPIKKQFEFDEEVAAVFDDMLARSVPFYKESQDITEFFVHKNLSENGLTSAVANSFMTTVDEALNQLNTVRSDFGSTQNQLESSIRNMATTHTNIKAAESVIRDVDYAAESANFNKQNIIAQAGTYAISQANNVQQNVLKLLQ